jgi:hypothetical protein
MLRLSSIDFFGFWVSAAVKLTGACYARSGLEASAANRQPKRDFQLMLAGNFVDKARSAG